MKKEKARRLGRERRHLRVRRKVTGTAEKPRLAIFRSVKHMYAQVIDDVAGKTLAAASTLTPELRTKLGKKTSGVEAAKAVGSLVGQRAVAKGLKQVCFDRAGFRYHGRVKALADAAREAGLGF
jgi:large subunit ribosomal protein L18